MKKKTKKPKFVKFSKGLYTHLKIDDKCYRQRYKKPHKKSVRELELNGLDKLFITYWGEVSNYKSKKSKELQLNILKNLP